jgi:hypothetical protein
MKNRKILLPAVLSMALVLSLILPASVTGASVTALWPDDASIIHSAVGSSSLISAMALNTAQGQVTPTVAVSAEAEYAIGNPNEAALQYTLTVSSSVGGSVTNPGEGTFTYNEGTVVDLDVKADKDYRFVNWTGDIATISCQCHSTTITMSGNYSIMANFRRTSTSADTCFIATAAYGTPMVEEVEILHEFRDKYLLTNPAGQAFVDFYYRVSPPIAQFITKHPSLKLIVRAGLMPVVAMSAIAVKTIPAEKMAITGLLVLVSGMLAVCVMRRQGRGPKCT